jgi:hypothetical protein
MTLVNGLIYIVIGCACIYALYDLSRTGWFTLQKPEPEFDYQSYRENHLDEQPFLQRIQKGKKYMKKWRAKK